MGVAKQSISTFPMYFNGLYYFTFCSLSVKYFKTKLTKVCKVVKVNEEIVCVEFCI